MQGLVDYHLHTSRCGHATGSTQDYIDQARRRGLAEIGFSDHLPLFHTIDATLAMDWDQFPLYVAEIDKLRNEPGSPLIRLGAEADYVPKFVDQTAEALAGYNFDYVLGAVHFIDGWGFDDRRYLHLYDAYDLDDLYQRYFELFAEAAGSGLFDVMAHPDLVKKYKQLEPEPRSLYERAAEAVAKAGVAMEVSTAGLRKPCAEVYPSAEFLKICKAYNIPVTLGSDAHAPEQVGYEFGQLLEVLRAAGYEEFAVFSGRVREMVKFDE